MHHNLGKRAGKSRPFRWGRAKYSKAQRSPISAQVRSDTLCSRSDLWVVAAEAALITAGQLEGIRRILIRQLRRAVNCGGRVLIRLRPNTPRSRRKVGLRMGGSKSPFSALYYRLRPGAILFELRGPSASFGINLLLSIGRKLPGGVVIRWHSVRCSLR